MMTVPSGLRYKKKLFDESLNLKTTDHLWDIKYC